MKGEEVVLRDFWNTVLKWARWRCPKVGQLKLRVDCPLMRTTRKTSPRAFMHTLHVPGTVCVAREAAGLDAEHLTGLFLHELGHGLATREWKRSEQEDADRAVREFFGVTIRYKGPLLLEWVPTHTMNRIMRQGSRLRR